MVRSIFHSPGLASCRCRPLSSNVRHQKGSRFSCQPEVRLSAWIEQPRGGKAANRLISVRAGVSAGQSKRTRTPSESANWVQQGVYGRSVSARMGGEHTNSGRASRVPARNQCQWAVVSTARRGALCKVPGMRRRRGVPRPLLPKRGSVSRIPGNQSQPAGRLPCTLMPLKKHNLSSCCT